MNQEALTKLIIQKQEARIQAMEELLSIYEEKDTVQELLIHDLQKEIDILMGTTNTAPDSKQI